ncbi:hypothetical protein PL10110_240068 [Planktothrix agardhii]|nr:hypothetical protein PL10110_240068 [Planktothrix agardhii]
MTNLTTKTQRRKEDQEVAKTNLLIAIFIKGYTNRLLRFYFN